jgi:hypothetical protein
MGSHMTQGAAHWMVARGNLVDRRLHAETRWDAFEAVVLLQPTLLRQYHAGTGTAKPAVPQQCSRATRTRVSRQAAWIQHLHLVTQPRSRLAHPQGLWAGPRRGCRGRPGSAATPWHGRASDSRGNSPARGPVWPCGGGADRCGEFKVCGQQGALHLHSFPEPFVLVMVVIKHC